ncbi:transporter substrate-binding domain-containing protein, partial [Alphaproteobacteria bacterium]|nr:transporter substrate-binding domain-containing protein [Alphaproteobacteria bacterium]
MKLKYLIGSLCAGILAIMLSVTSVNAGTLDDVKARGVLKCGINTGLAGFAYTDDSGNWRGFDVAYCQAVAAAIFGSGDKVEYVNLTGKTRFPALQSG